MAWWCVVCGRRPVVVAGCCSASCAAAQLGTIGALLNGLPRSALMATEWHELGASYARDMQALELALARQLEPV